MIFKCLCIYCFYFYVVNCIKFLLVIVCGYLEGKRLLWSCPEHRSVDVFLGGLCQVL
jgi:hypothetical protein